MEVDDVEEVDGIESARNEEDDGDETSTKAVIEAVVDDSSLEVDLR